MNFLSRLLVPWGQLILFCKLIHYLYAVTEIYSRKSFTYSVWERKPITTQLTGTPWSSERVWYTPFRIPLHFQKCQCLRHNRYMNLLPRDQHWSSSVSTGYAFTCSGHITNNEHPTPLLWFWQRELGNSETSSPSALLPVWLSVEGSGRIPYQLFRPIPLWIWPLLSTANHMGFALDWELVPPHPHQDPPISSYSRCTFWWAEHDGEPWD